MSLGSDAKHFYDLNAGAFLATNLVAVTTWTGFGSVLQRVLSDERAVRRFNIVMAVLLVFSLIPMLWP